MIQITHKFNLVVQNAKHNNQIWDQILPILEPAIALHTDPNFIDGHPDFFYRSLLAYADAGFHTLMMVQQGDGVLLAACSGGYEEHWYFLGSLLNCQAQVPCSSEQFVLAVQCVPCIQGQMIPSEVQAHCQLTEYTDGGTFLLPISLDHFITSASYKARSDWRRLVRKAEAAGLRVQKTVDWDALGTIFPGYLQHWASQHSSYSNEVEMFKHTVSMFKNASPDQYVGITLYLNNVPVAVNLAWLKDDLVLDTICVRNMDPKYKPFGLGIVAILTNIDACIELGKTRYSLCSGDQRYKSQFIGTEDCVEHRVNVLSDIDIALKNQVPGYWKGKFLTEDNLETAGNSLTSDNIIRLKTEYPFLQKALAPVMEQLNKQQVLNQIEQWVSSNHYSLNKIAWVHVVEHLYTHTEHKLYRTGNMLFTLEDNGEYHDFCYLVCAHPQAPVSTQEMLDTVSFASYSCTVITQGFDNPSDHGFAIPTRIALLPTGGIKEHLSTLSAGKRSALRRSVREPYVCNWSNTVSDWALKTYSERWPGGWAILQFIYMRSLVTQGLAQTLTVHLDKDQVAECYFVIHNNSLKFLAASFAKHSGIGMATQMFAVQRCYDMGIQTYDPTECCIYEEWDYNVYKGYITNTPAYVYSFAGTKDLEMFAPYALKGAWQLAK